MTDCSETRVLIFVLMVLMIIYVMIAVVVKLLMVVELGMIFVVNISGVSDYLFLKNDHKMFKKSDCRLR